MMATAGFGVTFLTAALLVVLYGGRAEACNGENEFCNGQSCCAGFECVSSGPGLGLGPTSGLGGTCTATKPPPSPSTPAPTPKPTDAPTPTPESTEAAAAPVYPVCEGVDGNQGAVNSSGAATTAPPELRKPAFQGMFRKTPNDPAVGVFLVNKGGTCMACTATAISNKHILTAKHCIQGQSPPVQVNFGSIKSTKYVAQSLPIDGVNACLVATADDYGVCRLTGTLKNSISPRELAAVPDNFQWQGVPSAFTLGYPLDDTKPDNSVAGDPYQASCPAENYNNNAQIQLKCLCSKGQSGSYISIGSEKTIKGILTQESFGLGFGLPITTTRLQQINTWMTQLT